jgi:hypothetical protein
MEGFGAYWDFSGISIAETAGRVIQVASRCREIMAVRELRFVAVKRAAGGQALWFDSADPSTMA